MTIAKELELFLTLFQTDARMLPFMYEEIESLVRWCMKRIIKPSIIDKNASGAKLVQVDLYHHELFVDIKDIDLGFDPKAAIKEKKKFVIDSQVFEFKKSYRMFLVKLLTKLQSKNPLRHNFVRRCAALNHEIMISTDNDRTKILD